MSASLVHGTEASAYDYLYVGGSVEILGYAGWNLAILRIDHATFSSSDPDLSILVYTEAGSGVCTDSTNLGDTMIGQAVYI